VVTKAARCLGSCSEHREKKKGEVLLLSKKGPAVVKKKDEEPLLSQREGGEIARSWFIRLATGAATWNKGGKKKGGIKDLFPTSICKKEKRVKKEREVASVARWARTLPRE